MLGVKRIDQQAKKVQLSLGDLKLGWCERILPTAHGPIELRWSKEGGRLTYSLKLPAGYQATIDNQSGLELVRK